MMDRFSPIFEGFLSDIKTPRKPEISNFLLVGFRLFLSSRVFLSGIKSGVNVVCTLLLPGKHPWSISSVAICKINSCLAPCAISVTLPFSARGARSVTSLT